MANFVVGLEDLRLVDQILDLDSIAIDQILDQADPISDLVIIISAQIPIFDPTQILDPDLDPDFLVNLVDLDGKQIFQLVDCDDIL